MNNTDMTKLQTPGFMPRVKSMLKLDFYRLFHTPAASAATLSSTIVTVLITLAASAAGSVLIGSISNLILKKRDLA